jgi:hypothetical protein
MNPLVAGLLLVCLAGGGVEHGSGPRTLRTGHLNELVPSASAPGQQFTIYLPPGFDASRPAPILYLMDPRGRARVPAKLFQDAAERYGYILISSHGTMSDGPVEPNLQAMQAMWDDSHAWFTIDPNRTYVAGFSGTARTATLFADQRPAFTGMIGVGAGLHPHVRLTPSTRFLYYAAIGEVDYNFHELQELEHALAGLNLRHRIAHFPGPHGWMPADVARRAIEWFELHAMRAGARPRDEALVSEWWQRDETIARARAEGGRVLAAARHYAAMARDYDGLRDVSGVASMAASLAASQAAKDELRRRTTETRASNEWVERALQTVAYGFPAGATAPVMPVHELVLSLDLARMKRVIRGQEAGDALEAGRRLNQIEVQLGFYLPLDALKESDFPRAAYYLDAALEIEPAAPVTWYLRGQLFARLKRPEEALAALRRSAEAGFRDVALLEADPAFRKLHGRSQYDALVAWLTAQGDTRDTTTVDRPPAVILKHY